MVKTIPMTHGTGMGPLPDLLEARSGSRAIARVFQAEGVPLGLIEHRAHWMPLAALAGLFERAAQETGDPLLGLHVGEEMKPAEYGLWVEFALQAPTLGDAFDRLARFFALHQVGGALGVCHRRDGRSTLYYTHGAIGAQDWVHHTDHIMPVMIRFVRSYLGRNWLPDAIEVAYDPPKDAPAREALLGTPWHFGRKRASIVMASSLLRHARPPAQGQEAGRGRAVTSYDVMSESLRQDSHDISSQISAILALRLLDRHTDIDGAAQMMGVSRRTLQRRLDASGQSYSDRLNHVRMGRAKALIEDTSLPLTAIAFDVGYSDPAHFTRAFRRHFGMPPSRLRASPTRPEEQLMTAPGL